MFARDGGRVDWAQLLAACEWAEVVFVGEEHDDATGHAVEAALWSDLQARSPDAVLSLEMLERDEQQVVNNFLGGWMNTADFIEQTGSTDWAGPDTWRRFYQPMLDAARQSGAPVVAANAPRDLVRKARREGYAALADLPGDQRKLFALPRDRRHCAYRRRFDAVMREHAAPATAQPATTQPVATQPAITQPASTQPASTQPDHDGELPPALIDAFFRGQLVWDATMAESIDRALGYYPRVMHVVGRFHVDFEGGLVEEVRARRPAARVLIISMEPAASKGLRSEDRGRADVVIYTASKEPPESR